MPEYFRSTTNRGAEERASQVLLNKVHNEFSDFFQELNVLKVHYVYRSRMTADHTMHPQEVSICTHRIPQGRARKTIKATNNSSPMHGQVFGMVQ